MAEVLLSTLADALGGPVVADATFTATASRARAVGDGVVANKTITVSVVQGVPSEPILLDHSGVDWCWRLRVVFPSIGVRIDRTVAVPDVPSVEWADLVDVDPATLLPAESAVPAWTAAVGQVAAILADTAVARDGAVVAQGASEEARDQAQVYAANTVELQDTTFTALIADPESATRAQLSATFVARASAAAELRIDNPGAFLAGNQGATTTWETPDGHGVIVHPSVRYFPDAWNGYRWWAAATPYFGADARLENPCIFVSTDGSNWVTPPGVTNPLHPAPSTESGYNSDTHLTQGPDGRLYLFFRDFTGTEKIRLFVSSDGVVWDGPTTVIENVATTKRLMSPAVWFDVDENAWVMLTVEILASPRVLERWTAPVAQGPWAYDRDVDIAPGFDTVAGRSIWHLDAMSFGSQVVALFQDGTSDGSAGNLYLATSEDSGRTFARASSLVTGGSYRSCLLPRVTEAGLTLDVWAGGGGPNWGARRMLAARPHQPFRDDASALLSMLAAKTATDPYVLGDDFGRADNPSSLDSAPSGQAWVVSAGGFGVVGQKAVGTTVGNNRVLIPTGISDMEVSARLTVGAITGNQMWLVVRAQDGSNFLRFGFNGALFTGERIKGGSASGRFGIGGYGAGEHAVLVRCVGTSVEVSINGLKVYSGTESDFVAATQVGIQANNAASSMDGIVVKRAA